MDEPPGPASRGTRDPGLTVPIARPGADAAMGTIALGLKTGTLHAMCGQLGIKVTDLQG
jgi:hypothetical protein